MNPGRGGDLAPPLLLYLEAKMSVFYVLTTQGIFKVSDIERYTIEQGNLYFFDEGLSIPTLIFNKLHWLSVEEGGDDV